MVEVVDVLLLEALELAVLVGLAGLGVEGRLASLVKSAERQRRWGEPRGAKPT